MTPERKEQRRRANENYRKKHATEILTKKREYNAAQREARSKASAEWKQRNRDKLNQRQRAWRKANPEKSKLIALKYRTSDVYTEKRVKKYGITLEQYKSMESAQSFSCAICSSVATIESPLCVDHNHATGAVRGLLCRMCNLAIGNLGDSASRISSALNYILRFP